MGVNLIYLVTDMFSYTENGFVTTHFEKLRTLIFFFQNALNLGQSQRTLKKNDFFQNALLLKKKTLLITFGQRKLKI